MCVAEMTEQEFEDIVTQYVSWPPLVNMSKTSHGTDRSCRIRNASLKRCRWPCRSYIRL